VTIVRDIQAANQPARNAPLTATPLGDIIGALDVKLLPDLQYARNSPRPRAARSTGPCYQAWIDIINTRQAAVNDPGGQALPMPDSSHRHGF